MRRFHIVRGVAAFAAALLLPVSLAMAQNSDMAVSTVSPATADAGATINVDTTVTNNGPDPATVIVDFVPPAGVTWLSFTQTSGTPVSVPLAVGASNTYRNVYAIHPNLASGTVLSFFTGTDVLNTYTDPNALNNNSTPTTTITTSADLAVTKTAPAAVAAGTNIPYSIGITNNGPSDTQGVVLVDTLPTGTTFVSLVQATGPAFTCTTPAVGAGGSVSCSLGTLANAANATFTLTLATSAAAAGTNVVNTATASATTGDPTPANNSASALTRLPVADLAIAASGPASVAAGSSMTYNVTITNNGPDDAGGVSFSDPLPPGTTFVSLGQNTGPAFTCATPAVGAGGTVSCTLASMPNGGTATFTLVAVAGIGTAGTTISNTAAVASTTTDPSAANNTATATTAVAGAVDVSITKAAPASGIAGSNVTYAIGVANAGPAAAPTVSLTDVLPGSTTFVSLAQSSGPAFACTTPAVGAGGTVSCTLASLANGAAAAFSLTLATSAAGNGTTVVNTATVASAGSDTVSANNTATASTILGGSADVSVTNTTALSVPVGGNIVYSLGIANAGPSNAQTVTLTDALPAGTTFVSLAQTGGPAFACATPAVGAGGTVTCNIAALASGASATFTLTAGIGGAIGGTPFTDTATAGAGTADPAVGNNSATATTTVGVVRSFTGPSATGTGLVTASFTGGGPGCTYVTAGFIPVTGDPASPPAASAPPGVTFPHGLFRFRLAGCTPGSAILMTIVYPGALPSGTSYWKYGPSPSNAVASWYQLPASFATTTATFSITDGAAGDDDLAADGTIVDPGGPGFFVSNVPLGIPTLSEWAMLLLVALIGGSAFATTRRR